MEKRFDHWFKEFEADGAKLGRHVALSIKEMRLAKASAYRMAKGYVALIRDFHNEFVEFLTASSVTIDEWLEKWFVPLDRIGEDYRELLVAVENGMTLKAYHSTTPAVFVGQLRQSAAKEHAVGNGDETCVTGAVEERRPQMEERMSAAERASWWKSRCLELEEKVRVLKEDLRETKRDFRRTSDALKRMDKVLKRCSATVAA